MYKMYMNMLTCRLHVFACFITGRSTLSVWEHDHPNFDSAYLKTKQTEHKDK